MSKRDDFVFIAIVVMFAVVAVAAAQKASTPKAMRKALGQDEVKQLLLLMDTVKDGRISKQEYMNFMAAEFDRLDKDKSGELDPRELRQSQLRVKPSLYTRW